MKPFFYADIETICSQDPAVMAEIVAKHQVPDLDLSAIVADGRLTDPDKINADIRKKQDKAIADHEAAIAKAAEAADVEYRKTSLNGATGHLVSIAWAFDEDVVVALRNEDCDPIDATWTEDGVEVDYTGETIFSDGFPVEKRLETITEGEAEMLEEFFEEIGDHLFNLAHAAYEAAVVEGKYAPPASNVVDIEPFFVAPIVVAHFADFDIRFIWQRAVALGVRVPTWWPVNASRYRDDQVQDTMVQWAGHGNRISLDALCRALGIDGKGDFDGSMVWDAIRAGKLPEVVDYNRGDVKRLRSVHRRLRGLKPLLIDIDPVAEDLYMNGGDLDTYVVNQITAAIPLDFANATNAAGDPVGWEA